MASVTAATAAASSGTVSLPLLALQEAKTHPVVVETRDGRTYRGILLSVDMQTGNVNLGKNICVDKSGYKIAMNNTLVKGSEIALVQLPPVIKNAPFLKADFIRSVKERTRVVEGSEMKKMGGSSKLAQRVARRQAEVANAAAGGNVDKDNDNAHDAEGRKRGVGFLSQRMKDARKGKTFTGGKRTARE